MDVWQGQKYKHLLQKSDGINKTYIHILKPIFKSQNIDHHRQREAANKAQQLKTLRDVE